ncbi:MAG: ZIP family metal transporter, partial [Clostridia bacterium]|nr:ZIP family metal transporter [Clostridia bacterium]
VVEPVFGALTAAFAWLVVPAMPYLLAFAAGAMFYVVVEELIPEISVGEHSNVGVLLFSAGFTVMMALDVALG